MAKKDADDLLGLPSMDIPTAKAARTAADIVDQFGSDVAFRMAFVGVGQAGGRIAEQFYDLGYRRIAAINTTDADLAELRDEIPKLNLGTGGAGKDMVQGESAVASRTSEVWELLTRAWGDQIDYAFVCAGLGGGTGSGASAKVLDTVKTYMADKGKSAQRAGAIVSLPQEAEGQRVCSNAVHAFQQLYKHKPSPFIIIDNDRINSLFRVGISSFYTLCNSHTAKLFHLFNRLAATRSNLITFDRADFATLLDSGVVVFGASEINKFGSPSDVSEAIRDQLEATALAKVNLNAGKKAGCIFVGSAEILDKTPMDYFDGGFTSLERLLADDRVVHRGIYQGGDKLRCYTMVADLPPPLERLESLSRRAGTAMNMAKFLGIDS